MPHIKMAFHAEWKAIFHINTIESSPKAVSSINLEGVLFSC